MRVGVATLALTAAVAVSSAGVHGSWVELGKMDCNGHVHMFPDMPFGASGDFAALRSALEAFNDRIFARVQERCPAATRAEVKRRMVPSLDMLLNFMAGAENRNTSTDCVINDEGTTKSMFSDNILGLGSFISMITSGSACSGDAYRDQYYSYVDASGLLPATCLSDFRDGNGCKMQFKFTPKTGNQAVQFAADNCPDTKNAWPYMSVTCSGSMCENWAKPCTQTSECGEDGQCDNFASVIPQGTDVAQVIKDAMVTAGIMSPSTPKDDIWSLLIRPVREYWGSYFPAPGVGNTVSDYLKFCVPKQQGGMSFVDMIRDITPTCSPTAPTPPPTMYPVMSGRILETTEKLADALSKVDPEYSSFYQLAKSFAGIASLTVDYVSSRRVLQPKDSYCGSVDINEIFETVNGQPLTCEGSTMNLHDYNCPSSFGSGVRCVSSMKVQTANLDSKPAACDAASNGNCNFMMVGDGICNPACNIAQCGYDASDCIGPAAVIVESPSVSICYDDNEDSSYLAVTNAACNDPEPSYASCAYQFTSIDEGKFIYEIGQPYGTKNEKIAVAYSGYYGDGYCTHGKTKWDYYAFLCSNQTETYYCNGPTNTYNPSDECTHGFDEQQQRYRCIPNDGECRYDRCPTGWQVGQAVTPGRCNGKCLCTATEERTSPSLSKNLYYRVQEVNVSCNHVHSWDGELYGGRGNVLAVERKVPDSPFPPVRIRRDESLLSGLDCGGIFTFGFVVPFFRVDASKWLTSVKVIESVYRNLVKARNDGQGAIFEANGWEFTDLGYRVFGVYTMPFALNYLTTSSLTPPSAYEYFAGLPNRPLGVLAGRNFSNPNNPAFFVSMPTSCTYANYLSARQCLLLYEGPVLASLGIDVRLYGAARQCPGTNIPSLAASLQGDWIKFFPFFRPCSNDVPESCPQGGKCVDMFQYAKTTKPFRGEQSLGDLDYDILTFFLNGAYGRSPNWQSHQAPSKAWITEDFLYLASNIFGAGVPDETYLNAPATGHGNVSFCFPASDMLLTPILETGQPFDLGGYVQQNNIELTAMIDEIVIPSVAQTSAVYEIIGMKRTGYYFGGATGAPTPPTNFVPSNKPTITSRPTKKPTLPPGVTASPTMPTMPQPSAAPVTEQPTTPEPTQLPTTPSPTLADGATRQPTTKKPTVSKLTAGAPGLYVVGIAQLVFVVLAAVAGFW